jgi:hypothetical protein
MGSPAQANAPTQVYYDPEKQQYFSYKPAENSNPIANMMMGLGVPVTVNGQPYSQTERMYLSSPYANETIDRFTPKYVPATYPNMDTLFPTLNYGLAQNISNSLLSPTGTEQSSGVGRFLAPSNTSKGK